MELEEESWLRVGWQEFCPTYSRAKPAAEPAAHGVLPLPPPLLIIASTRSMILVANGPHKENREEIFKIG